MGSIIWSGSKMFDFAREKRKKISMSHLGFSWHGSKIYFGTVSWKRIVGQCDGAWGKRSII